VSSAERGDVLLIWELLEVLVQQHGVRFLRLFFLT
jgi:hypothetical protein